MDTKLIGLRIKQARKRANLTQTELADAIGLSQSYIQRFESAEREPSIEQLNDIARALSVSVQELLGPNLREIPVVIDTTACRSPNVILSHYTMPHGLRDLASDTALHSALRVSADDWQTLATLATVWPDAVRITRDGWASVLLALRAASVTKT